MRIALGPDTYAEWTPGARTINYYTFIVTPTEGFWQNYDCSSFGYKKPDNTTTQIEAIDVIIRRLIDAAMDRHPTGRR